MAEQHEPTLFREVYGNNGTIKRLKATLRNDGASNFFLLTGPKGHGKSTLSDVSAMYTLCENPTDMDEPCHKCSYCRANLMGSPKGLIKINVGLHSNNDFIVSFKEMLTDRMEEKLVIQLEELQEMSEKTQGAMLEVLDTLVKKETQVTVIATSYKHYQITKAIRDRAFILQVGLTSAELKVYVESIAEGHFTKETINYLLQKKMSPREYKNILQNHIAASLTSIQEIKEYFREANELEIGQFLISFMSPYPQFHSVMHNYSEEELIAVVKSALFNLTRVAMSSQYGSGNKSAGDYNPYYRDLFKDYSSVDMYRIIYYLNELVKSQDIVNDVYAKKYLFEQSKKDDSAYGVLKEQNRQLYSVLENIEDLSSPKEDDIKNSDHYKKITAKSTIANMNGYSFALPTKGGA